MSAPGQASGTSLLLIFSAIDLLCSAMVCGVLLTVVLIGGSGTSVVASEGEGGATGVTIVEAWLPPGAKLSLDGVKPDESAATSSSEVIRAIVPAAVRRQIYMLPPGMTVIQLRASGSLAAVIHAGTGESLLVAISCQQDATALVFYIAPQIRLPNCIADTSVGSRKLPPSVVVCAPAIPVGHADPLLTNDVRRTTGQLCSPNQSYTSKTSLTVPSELGVWAVLL